MVDLIEIKNDCGLHVFYNKYIYLSITYDYKYIAYEDSPYDWFKCAELIRILYA